MRKGQLLAMMTVLAGAAVVSVAQTAAQPDSQVMGRGRGGAPYAWNDKDKDGICDITGQPVGQARGAVMAGQGMGRGRGGGPHAWMDKDNDGLCDLTGQPVGQARGIAAGRQMGRGRGYMRGFAAQQQTQPDTAQ